MNRYYVAAAAGVCSLVAVAVIFFQINNNRKGRGKKKNDPPEEDIEDQVNAFLGQRDLYIDPIIDQQQYSLIIKNPQHDPTIESLKYYIVLNLKKGTNYDGVVRIKVKTNRKNVAKTNLYVDFSGHSIMYLAVNDYRVPEAEVIYHYQRILIKKEWLGREENTIQVIFDNKYAFMGDGLTTYFPLDDNNKYSLKGQMIYTRNGVAKIVKIFPCFNVLNPCLIKLQILHYETFEAFSNTPRSLMRRVDHQDYPFYGFFFNASEKMLQKTFKMKTSQFMETSTIRSFEEVMRQNTQFYETELPSIHDFFVLCSKIHEVRPADSVLGSKDLLIRYFAKDHLSKKLSMLLNILQCQIAEIVARIQKYRLEKHADIKCHHKIDIFFIDDLKAEGDFYLGSIFLSESTVERGVCDRRIYYMLCRAVVGMSLIGKNDSEVLTLSKLFDLHQLVLDIFPECLDFLYVKQKQYEHIRQNALNLISKKRGGQDQQLQLWFQQYYEKQCRYFVKNINEAKVSHHVYNLLKKIEEISGQNFWMQFVASYPFIEGNISQILIKIGIRYKGIPTRRQEIEYAQGNFLKSKYYLKFFTNDEIQKDLKRFIDLKSFGLEKRLPFIKIKQKVSHYIDQKMENYLPIKANRNEAKTLYSQFKRYNQARNFHHISALRREIKRINLLARDQISEQRRELQCGLIGWKLLMKLKIMPADEQVFKLIMTLETMKNQTIKP